MGRGTTQQIRQCRWALPRLVGRRLNAAGSPDQVRLRKLRIYPARRWLRSDRQATAKTLMARMGLDAMVIACEVGASPAARQCAASAPHHVAVAGVASLHPYEVLDGLIPPQQACRARRPARRVCRPWGQDRRTRCRLDAGCWILGPRIQHAGQAGGRGRTADATATEFSGATRRLADRQPPSATRGEPA